MPATTYLSTIRCLVCRLRAYVVTRRRYRTDDPTPNRTCLPSASLAVTDGSIARGLRGAAAMRFAPPCSAHHRRCTAQVGVIDLSPCADFTRTTPSRPEEPADIAGRTQK
ncbi:hypothetical protein RPB_4071 [Rhodopseudomonas palustris HaA2]|uniref:Uncharacterized protein n=1 Tax=Rhodopseudomonas palustris (strain HaA2) TaxID=316058 RepID=Q2ISP6_RHOP2|nr:hypothetical protein RPB_4071 [Rhodopseudomonas palustris HaA2]